MTTPEEWPNFEAKQKDLRLLLPPATTALAPYNNGCAVEACVDRSKEREQPSLCHSNSDADEVTILFFSFKLARPSGPALSRWYV